MIGKIATLIGYKKAPKATFVLKHPIKGTAALMAVHPKRTLTGLGAVLAIPLGILWASKRNGGAEE